MGKESPGDILGSFRSGVNRGTFSSNAWCQTLAVAQLCKCQGPVSMCGSLFLSLIARLFKQRLFYL